MPWMIEAASLQPVKIFLALHGTRRFIITFTSATLVISCLWCHSNIIWGEKHAICVPVTDDTNTDSEP